ncbi:helix-turn-helix domain-containing protein [Nocardia nova]|uniref:helix-turn-helix domain-containing protein n=1 Tax=Nocardia nova TaxID=37330 RepID=UPI0033C7C268
MTTIGEDQSTTLPRRQLGRYLKDARLAVGLRLEDVAPLMQWSASKLSRIEAGRSPAVRVLDVEALCRIYEIDDPEVTAGLVGLAKQSIGKSWWQAFEDVISDNFNLYVGLESSARKLTIFRPDIVAGLFQTLEYSRALNHVYYQERTTERVELRAQLMRRRQAAIIRKTNPIQVDLVVQEAALRTIVGDPAIMAAQLHNLANLPANASVRVLPFSAGFPVGSPTGPFVILDFGQDSSGRDVSPTVVYIESYAGDMYIERAADVARFREAFNTVQQAALDVTESKRLIRQMAREFRP